jgi:KUP system potassium uptake protein
LPWQHAAVIASQAVITGVFSMANQAIQLRYLPRLTVHHTSDVEQGQIYYPLLIGYYWLDYFLILIFQTSANLANAYGAVTMTMLCDTILISFWHMVFGVGQSGKWHYSRSHF